jgi:hypothetical protein
MRYEASGTLPLAGCVRIPVRVIHRCDHYNQLAQWHSQYAYSAVIDARGGCLPYKWEIVSGALPAGINAAVSSATRSLNLTGTPTTAATNSIAIKVTGCGGHVSNMTYKIVIQGTANHVVELSWQASSSNNVVGYNVYRSLDGATWQRINISLVASMFYSDSTVANSTTYYYATTAVDIYGQESNKSASMEAVIP